MSTKLKTAFRPSLDSFEARIVATGGVTAAVVHQAAHPQMRALFDCYHFWSGQSKFEDLDLITPGDIGHVHFQDVPDMPRELLDQTTRVIPGDGVTPLVRILRKLSEKSYAGPLSVELFLPRFQQGDPYDVAREAMGHLLFPKGHPYYGNVIGSHADVEAARLLDVRDFFQHYYTPNNASVAIVGDFDAATIKAKVEKFFGPIAKGPAIDKVNVVTPPITSASPSAPCALICTQFTKSSMCSLARRRL